MSFFYDKMIHGPRILLVTGHFGSGKTEFCVSLALTLAESFKGSGNEEKWKERKLALADLDVENPYFRSRECQNMLEAEGIDVYSDPFDGRNQSELQTISAAVLAPVENPDCRVILDTGGNDTGAKILNQFSRHFGNSYQMIYVVNAYRPGSDTVEKVIDQIVETEKATGLVVTGLISNTHLLRETTVEDILYGYQFTKKLSSLTDIPVLCVCSADPWARELEKWSEQEKINAGISGIEVFPIGMHMRRSYMDK